MHSRLLGSVAPGKSDLLPAWINRGAIHGWRALVALAVSLWIISIGYATTATGDRTLSPYFWVKPVSSGSDGATAAQADPLPLKSTHVEATVAGVFANVKVTQHYANVGAVPLEAMYVFPGSTRAAVHGLTMTVGGRRIEATVKEKAEARRTYEAAKTAGKTTSLLEQHRPNVFQMNVANILPGDDVAVELRYTELLIPDNGEYQFVYPGVVGPRYSTAPAEGVSPAAAATANPFLHNGEADPAAYTLSVNLMAGVPLQAVQCRTHSASIAHPTDREARIEMQDTNGADRDFILSYRLVGADVQSGLMLAEGRAENFFLLMVEPPARPIPAQIPPREYVFIVDVSGSMNGFPLQTAKQLMGDLLSTLRPEDSFNVILFAGGNQVFAPASVHATPQAISAAQDLLDRQCGAGATELLPALRQAFAMPQSETVSRTFLVITDGYVDVEPEAFELTRANLGKANLFAFGIGSSVNRHLIEGLARCGQGEPFIATDPEMSADVAAKFSLYVSAPVLTRVNVSFQGIDAYDIEPVSVPDLLARRPIVVHGKWRGAARGRVVVTGFSGAAPYRAELDLGSAVRLPDADGLSRLWARTRITSLADLDGLNSVEERKPQILALGLKYNLLTRYTSFVAVDEVVRRVTPTLQSVKQPAVLPASVENSAVGGSVGAAPEPGAVGLAVVVVLLGVAFVVLRRRKPLMNANSR